MKPAFRFRPRAGVWGQPICWFEHELYWIPRRSYYTQKGRGRLFWPPLPLDDKSVAHWILGAGPPFLPTYIFHKHPILINVFLAYHFVSEFLLCRGILLQRGWRTWTSVKPDTWWVFLIKNCGFKSQSGFRLGLSPDTWVQVPICVLARFRPLVLSVSVGMAILFSSKTLSMKE